jgi:hypothetical protein
LLEWMLLLLLLVVIWTKRKKWKVYLWTTLMVYGETLSLPSLWISFGKFIEAALARVVS